MSTRNICYAIVLAACLGVGLAAMYTDSGGFTPRDISQGCTLESRGI